MASLLKPALTGVAFVILATVAQAQLYAVVSAEGSGPDVGSLLVLDPSSGSIVERIPLTRASGGAVMGLVGIAAHPETGVLYVIDDDTANVTDRRLARVDPSTGILTDIGPMGDAYCGLTFGADGTLYAIGAVIHSTDEASVHTVNLATGAATLFRASDAVLAGGFPNDADGDGIEFNPADGRLYWVSNYVSDLMRMNLTTKIASSVATNGDVLSRAGLAYEASSGTFLAWYQNGPMGDEFFRINPVTGDVSVLGMNVAEGNTIRDLAFATPVKFTSAPAVGRLGLALLMITLGGLGTYSVRTQRRGVG